MKVTKESVRLLPEFDTLVDEKGVQHNSRICLDMKLINCKSKEAVIIIVMLNPGSCDVKDQVVLWDSTLHRIKNILSSKVDWIRILNLSDIKCAKESIFFKLIDEFPEQHSIFNSKRKIDLDKYIVVKQGVFFACGTNKKATQLLNQAKDALKNMGIEVLNETEPYYHPLVRPDNIKAKWEFQITHVLKKRHLYAS